MILAALDAAGVEIATASHNGRPRWCDAAMDLIVIDEAQGITFSDVTPAELRIVKWQGKYGPSKNQHLQDIKDNLRCGPCEFNEMMLFDDSKINCKKAEEIGVISVRAFPNGLAVPKLMEGLQRMQPSAGLRPRW